MEKLKLDLDELVVESFNTAPGSPPEGTVAAHQQSGPYTDECWSCGGSCGMQTCDVTCDVRKDTCGTCAISCGQSCWGTCDYESCRGSCWGQYTCAGADTCQYPACTGPGAAC
jgi:hypothetical protein